NIEQRRQRARQKVVETELASQAVIDMGRTFHAVVETRISEFRDVIPAEKIDSWQSGFADLEKTSAKHLEELTKLRHAIETMNLTRPKRELLIEIERLVGRGNQFAARSKDFEGKAR